MKGIKIWEAVKRALHKGQFMGREEYRQRMEQSNRKDEKGRRKYKKSK